MTVRLTGCLFGVSKLEEGKVLVGVGRVSPKRRAWGAIFGACARSEPTVTSKEMQFTSS